MPPEETVNPPADVASGKPAAEAEQTAKKSDQESDDKYLALRNRAIEAERKAQRLEDEKKKSEADTLAKRGEYQKLYEQEKAAREATEAKAARVLKRAAIQSALSTMGLEFDDGVIDLAPLDQLSVEDERVTNASEVAAAFVKARPKLFPVTKTGKNGTPFTTPQATPGGTQLPIGTIKASDVHKMSPDQLQAYLSAVSKVAPGS